MKFTNLDEIMEEYRQDRYSVEEQVEQTIKDDLKENEQKKLSRATKKIKGKN
jgi:6-phosphogluconolactonase/glucosamine-6-phosphate isomerase/deaminase